MGILRQVVGFFEESVIPRSDMRGFTLLVVITVLILVNIK